jgi:hypothetical protein
MLAEKGTELGGRLPVNPHGGALVLTGDRA